jgi:hypothetical protein
MVTRDDSGHPAPRSCPGYHLVTAIIR